MDKGLSKITKISFNKVFNDFRRDTELLHIGKAIQHTPATLTVKQSTIKRTIERKQEDSTKEPSYSS